MFPDRSCVVRGEDALGGGAALEQVVANTVCLGRL